MIHGRALPWVRGVVPALGGLAIHFEPDHAALTTDALSAALNIVSECLKEGLPKAGDVLRTVEVPVCYEPEFAPDLAEVAAASKVTAEQAVELHAGSDYRVLMIGFAPGHAYMGGHGHQHVGLCPGGAMDPLALTLANALVGNHPGAAALELTVLGPDLLFARDTLIALVGAEFETDFPINRPVLLGKGARISVSRAARGARGYLAVAGGIAVDDVLGSRRTHLPGGFGGLDGRVLKRGDKLPLAEDAAKLSRERFAALKNKDKRGSSVRWHVPALTVPDREPIVLHAIEGEHFADFDANMQRVFFDT